MSNRVYPVHVTPPSRCPEDENNGVVTKRFPLPLPDVRKETPSRLVQRSQKYVKYAAEQTYKTALSPSYPLFTGRKYTPYPDDTPNSQS